MSVTILGQHIRLVRPEKISKPRVPTEAFKPKYDTTPKTREIGCAEFFKLCLDFVDNVPRPKPWR